MFLFSALATLPLLAVLVSLALGWLATAHLVYEEADQNAVMPAAAVAAIRLIDRMLAGQAIILHSAVRNIAMLREFLAGLANLSMVPATAAETPAAATWRTPVVSGWLTKAMGVATTASRVQSRMYGHVVREIAISTNKDPADIVPQTPTTPVAGLLGLMLRGSSSASAATPATRTPRRPSEANLSGNTVATPTATAVRRLFPPLLEVDDEADTTSGSAAQGSSQRRDQEDAKTPDRPPWSEDEDDDDEDESEAGPAADAVAAGAPLGALSLPQDRRIDDDEADVREEEIVEVEVQERVVRHREGVARRREGTLASPLSTADDPIEAFIQHVGEQQALHSG